MAESLGSLKRTHNCAQLRVEDIEKEVILTGWVQRRRDHGGVIFIDLRDREGITQVVFNPEENSEVHEKAHGIRSEYVLAVKGQVVNRLEGTVNPNLPTGAIEILVSELKILNEAKTPPFMIEDGIDIAENLRLKYRYLDLRRPSVAKGFVMRHRVSTAVRAFLNGQGFLDLETPMLTKSTPEGARDYLVPSRVNPGAFYALPQSPQLFKQMLMVSGFDRYYQIVKCFRDEDLRSDRQPEFTQIDMELSFVDREDVMSLTEAMMKHIFREVLDVDFKESFPVMTYEEAERRFGLDKPDIRFGLEHIDLSGMMKGCGFKVFADVASKGGLVKAINVKGGATFSRKDLDDLTSYVGNYGAKGMAWIKVTESEWQSPIVKFFNDDEIGQIAEKTGAEVGDLLLFGADKPAVVNESLGMLRNELARRLGLVDKGTYSFLWVTDFPLLEFDGQAKRHVAIHHPFTAPLDEDMHLLDSEPGKARSKAYDLVLNGSEIGGGSIRIHQQELQQKIFELLHISEEEASSKFGFLLDALQYGAPPHGGLALGLDRIVMIMSGADSIRDVITFPKTQKASCLMTEAPSTVEPEQLTELNLALNLPKKETT
ncbi:MAG: aspartate--tRNA ligase [Proteobacteria bacterium]|nr:aspartate--tRNA ligase [Pseudomonadota bacterium]